MGTRDPRLDAYIAKSPDFAKPILTHIRSVVHEACPNVVETMKWGAPHFDYKGIMCGMAAFKQHCAFGFWKTSLITGGDPRSGEAMGQFGRIEKLSDLPPKTTLKRYVRKAMELNESGVTLERPRKRPKKEIPSPRTSRPCSGRTGRRSRRSRASARATGANTWSGSRKRSVTKPGSAGSSGRSHGWPKASRELEVRSIATHAEHSEQTVGIAAAASIRTKACPNPPARTARRHVRA